MNSFLQFEEEEMQRFVSERQDTVRRRVEEKVSTHRFVGDVVELFFPRMADTVTVLLGGDVITPEPAYLTIQEADPDLPPAIPPPPGPPAGPADRDEIIR